MSELESGIAGNFIAERAGYRSNGTPAYEHIAAAIRARSNNNA